MENMMSKTTLYDMLSMIIPGFITLLSFWVICFGRIDVQEICKDGMQKVCGVGRVLTVAIYVCVFTLSYIVGMFIHCLSQLAFNRIVRNNTCLIKDAREKFQKDIDKRRKEDTDIDNDKKIDDEHIKADYYERYYVAAHYPFSAIPILESQVSFIRSMLLVILLGCIAVCRNGGLFSIPPCCAITILLALDLIAFFHMLCLQKKIHFRVYEDSYYMKLIKGGWKGDDETKDGSSVADDKDAKGEMPSNEDSKKSMTKPKK